jgi:hypothetical protein
MVVVMMMMMMMIMTIMMIHVIQPPDPSRLQHRHSVGYYHLM